MGIRKSQVEKIKNARMDWVLAQHDPNATKQDRARLYAVEKRVRANSSQEEIDAASRVGEE